MYFPLYQAAPGFIFYHSIIIIAAVKFHLFSQSELDCVIMWGGLFFFNLFFKLLSHDERYELTIILQWRKLFSTGKNTKELQYCKEYGTLRNPLTGLKHAKTPVWSFQLWWWRALSLERNFITVRAWATSHNHLSQWLTFTICAPSLVPHAADIFLHQADATAAQLYTHTHTDTQYSWLMWIRRRPRGSTWVSRDSA